MEVHLAIYDLSNGMARNLSAQFLGPSHVIDMIPHTALLVYGKEWFFGGGIQAVDPNVFRSSRGIQPCKIQKLGTTQTTQAEFEGWCRNQPTFNANSYDLLHRNCNNFSHQAALQGLKLTRGIPDWILHVPQKFMASPMGQMVRPMLEDMQITQMAPVNASPPTFVNPWATLPPSTKKSSFATATLEEDYIEKPPSILIKFTKPMLSNDTQSLPLCIKKLSPLLNQVSSDDEWTDFTGSLLQGDKVPSAQKMIDHIRYLLQEGTLNSFVLLLLRLVVLKYPSESQECMEWLSNRLVSGEEKWITTPMTKSLAWCVVSNYCATQSAPTPHSLVDAALADWQDESIQVRQAASTYLYNYILSSTSSSEKNNDDCDDSIVSILCSSLERVTEELDPTTRLRQLVLVGRLVFPNGERENEVAKELVQDLGFGDMLQELLSNNRDGRSKDASSDDCQQLAAELAYKLNQDLF